MAKSKQASYRVKGRKLTSAQAMQKAQARQSRSSIAKAMVDHKSYGTGKYAKRSSTPLTNRQAYKLEKRSLMNERAGLETKPELIKAAGQALAMNIAPATSSYGATAGTSKIIEAANKNNTVNKSVSNLINGGVDQAGTSNDEEIEDFDSLPGGANIR